MALLRRRKKQPAAPPPRASDPANAVPAATGPQDWRPASLSQALPAIPDSANRHDSWVPSGVERPAPGMRRAKSNPSLPVIQAPPEPAPAPPAPPAESAPSAASAPPAPPAESAPPVGSAPPAPPAPSEPAPREAAPADREELHARIASLEDQIAAARASRSGEQDATIKALQLRLASLEEELDSSPRMAPLPSRAATAFRLWIVVALFVIIAGSPLYMSQRSICHTHGRPHTQWSIVAPFDNSGPAACKNQLGGSVLLDAIGLK